MLKVGSILDNKYEILTQIGRGGMSTVFLAMDKRLNKQWAIKEIRRKGNGKNDDIIFHSLIGEANMMKRLDHPALPRIVDIIEEQETICVVMDYIEGQSLDKYLEEYGAQKEEDVINWAKQLCDVLSYLHSQKPPIIYRDMKPANVMLKPEGNVKIIDFGIAREYKEQNTNDTKVLGTRGYAPPEQYNGQTDARSDIYALGMTMHQLLTGVNPTENVYHSIRYWNADLSEGLEYIVNKCVEPAAENRYQNCEELLYDLNHPELVTKDYKRKQKAKFMKFAVSAGMAFVMFLIGLGCNLMSSHINSQDYNNLIEAKNDPSSYKQAIEIYPEDTRAYSLLLDSYLVEEASKEAYFTKSESNEFLALFNANINEFDMGSKEYADLIYKIGSTYFNYYTNDEFDYSFSDRIQKAYPFFEINKENEKLSSDFENATISNCYFEICNFYKKYILASATIEEASKEDYVSLLSTIDNTLDSISNEGAHDQLSLCNGVFMLLYDQRTTMASVKVEEQDVQSLLDKVYKKAKTLTTQKDTSKQIQREIIDNYSNYKEMISRTYLNAKEND